MRAVLPGRPPAKLQSFSTTLWEGLRVVAYISGHALVILGGPQQLLQTIYVDDTESLEAVAIDEASGKIAVCGGPDVFVYQPYGIQYGTLKWSRVHTFRCEDDDETIRTLSWGGPDELLLGNSNLALWFLNDSPRLVWKQKLGSPVKLAQFSPDATLVVTTGLYDRLVKVWRRLAFGADDARFDIFYLAHPTIVTGMHWRRPLHREQSMENALYTICADNKIRVWTATDHMASSALQLWTQIDLEVSVQPRNTADTRMNRRYGFVLDSRDFCAATERAVLRSTGNKGNHALEHIIEVANKSPEICVVIDGQGHLSAWALEDVSSKVPSESRVFNILHVEGLNFSFLSDLPPAEDYTQLCAFQRNSSAESISILVHHFDGRIEWFDSPVDVLFDPTRRKNRVSLEGSWCGHNGPIKKVVRSAVGDTLVSRTDDNHSMVWKRKGSRLSRQSSLLSEEHIHRTCIIGNGRYLINLHHDAISLWDVTSIHAQRVGMSTFELGSKPLCVLPVPTADKEGSEVVYIATIGTDMTGIAWEVDVSDARGQTSGDTDTSGRLRQFCTFSIDPKEDISYILPVDPAGSETKHSGSFDLFSPDIALSYTETGVIRTWTAKVDRQHRSIDWLLKSTVGTGIENPSFASANSIRKAALVDEDRTRLTIWDTSGAQLEFEESFSQQDIIRDLDWTSTPDMQSILAVGFPHKVILLSQLRYDYLDAGPSWTQIREIWIRDLTPHPIGDSCWLSDGNLVIGAGNQLFVYDKEIDMNNNVALSDLRIPSRGMSSVDLFGVVSRLNGPLPVFHPQFLAQCILSGKNHLVHVVLTALHRKLKFYTEGDNIDNFLGLPLEHFYIEHDTQHKESSKELHSPYVDFEMEDEPSVMDEAAATILNETLSRIALPQLSSQEQFRLVDTIECVATVEKHRRAMDDNAARYLLFFRQHMLRRVQGVANKDSVSWREVVWAYHSDSHDILSDLVSRQFGGKLNWKSARESGIFFWLTDTNAIRAQLEIVARNEYTKTEEKNPIDCSLYYLALGKKNILQGLWRMATWHREQAPTQRLLANDFREARWKTSALKNAYALLGKRRFEYAAAFFVLADHIRDAAHVCLNQMGDLQLAIAITRAYEGDDGPVLKGILEERVLPDAAADGNRWMASWAFWMLGRRDMAVRSLISPIESLITLSSAEPVPLQAKSYLSNDPALVVLYKQLREKTLQTLKGASQISPYAEWNFILRNARLYDRMGCDLLALDLIRHWEFLQGPPPAQAAEEETQEDEVDYRKMLRRRSSLVVADMPIRPAATEQQAPTPKPEQPAQPKPPPTMFTEPDSNSLLDSFGF